MTGEGNNTPQFGGSPASAIWRQQSIPPELVRELRRRTEDGRRTGPTILQRAWVPAVATLILLLVAHALRDPSPRPAMRAELRSGRVHLIWFQPTSGETER
jgi:hypothetical protein